ncbi:MAG TPA: RDD family protein [Candidatus Acidoferrales bacterium]|nr:RDD family protein [Candidatus Acidoferrales bacterium]
MYCSKCGIAVSDKAAFCQNCGQRVTAPPMPLAGVAAPQASVPPPAQPYASAPSSPVSELPGGATPPLPPPPGAGWQAGPAGAAGLPPGAPMQTVYVPMPSPFAGFWLRFVAWIIDEIILCFGVVILFLVVLAFIGIGTFQSVFENVDNASEFLPFSIVFGMIVAILGAILGQWLYYAWMESSSHQGTVGKIALGLVVTDLQGRRVSFARATGRFFSRIITRLTFGIGYIIAGFTERKQTLHDMIASCLVLRKL